MRETYEEFAPESNPEFDIAKALSAIWAWRIYLVLSMLLIQIVTVTILLWLPNSYRAETLLAPNDGDGANSLSSLAAQFGGLASLAGIGLPDSGSNKINYGLEVLQSRSFVFDFISDRNILVPLMASERWDQSANILVIDDSQYDSESGDWIRKVKLPLSPEPSLQEAYEEFMERLTVKHDKETGFVSLTFTHHSPQLAAKWLNLLVEDLNRSIMERDVREAQQAISYLYDQIAQTPVAELKNVFFNLIEEQTKTIMLSRVSEEYLFKVIDPALAPEKKHSPKRALIILVVSIFFGFVMCIVVIAVEGFRERKQLVSR